MDPLPASPSPSPAPSPMGQMPHSGVRPEYVWAGIVLVVAVLAGSFFVLRNVQANADYICTQIVEFTGGCSDGSWSAWQTTGSTQDQATCTSVASQGRTYTGTRTTSRTLQYLNLRTDCLAGYIQTGNGGGGGGASGFHGGTVFTHSSACQIQESRTVTSAIAGCTPSASTAGIRYGTSHSERTESDIGNTSQTTEASVNSLAELEQYRRGQIAVDISAHPALVRQGETTLIRWQGKEVESCSVSGSNGDSWTGPTAGEEISGAIPAQTTYTLTCTAFDGSTATDQVIVDVTPSFSEE